MKTAKSFNNFIYKTIIVISLLSFLLFFPGCPQSPILSRFLTDGIPPSLLSIIPANGENMVTLDTSITMTFSESMDRSAMEKAFSLNPGGITGTFTWGDDDKELIFQPGTTLSKMILYTVEISTEAVDNNNVGIEDTITSTFTTRTAPKIKGGATHTMALKMDGSVWCWGGNSNKQLGNDSTVKSLDPIQVTGLSNVKEISTGSMGSHNIALMSDLSVRLWGNNTKNQLGIGAPGPTPPPQGLPVEVNDANSVMGNIIDIATGLNHTLALKDTGQILAWGDNSSGQLGLGGSNIDQPTPFLIPGISTIAKIFCGHSFSAAISTDERVWLWGMNLTGQLGQNPFTFQSINTPTELTFPGPVKDISCSNQFAVALVDEGGTWNVYTWGSNDKGALGRTTTNPDSVPGKVDLGGVSVSQIATGFQHVLALTETGKLYGWGLNNYKQLGITTSLDYTSTPSLIPIEDVIDIAAGEYHSIALKSDGTVWTWGSNTAFQLGRDNTTVVIDSVPGLNLNY